MIPNCPRCGTTRGVYRNGRAGGKVQGYYDEQGNPLEVFTDCLFFDYSPIIRCEECTKIRRDLQVNWDGCIVLKEGE